MNNETKLRITFAPVSEQNAWTPPVSSDGAEPADGAQASARFTVNLVKSPENEKPRKSSRLSGVNAALRIAPTHNRYARRRFFAPRHTFEYRLP